MKKIILVAIPLALLIGILIYIANKPSATNSLGNRLAEYFYYINTSVASNEKLSQEQQRNIRNKESDLRKFYKKLDWTRQKEIVNYHSEPRGSWNQINSDGNRKLNYLAYWQSIRPFVHSVYEKNIDKVSAEYPVIHFRCSDIPFMKYEYYHLTKATSVKWMADKIKERGFAKAILLSCNEHLTLDQKSCAQYVDFYIDLFNSYGIEIEKQCNTIFKDFAMMVYSPLLVSLNSSSFAFMAGISKNPRDYVSCNMGMEYHGVYVLQTEADWLLDPREPLLHKNVEDYHQVEEVIKELNK